MPDPYLLSVPKSATIEQVNQRIAQAEPHVGPLFAMGIEQDHTVLSFDKDEFGPDKHAVVIPVAEGGGNAPAGTTKVCDGEIYVEGKKTLSIAVRPK